jgi:putative mRNA 3-end processing factor
MITKVTRQMLSTPSAFIKDKDVLARMFFEKVKSPHNEAERNDIAQRPGIFITTSGMLQGGPVMHYLKHLWHDQKNAVFLTGYQCKRTNGRELLDTGYVNLKGWRTKVHCQVEQFEFSGHADRQALKEYIKAVNPKALVIQHGDPESVDAMVAWANETLKIPVFGPKVGDEIVF